MVSQNCLISKGPKDYVGNMPWDKISAVEGFSFSSYLQEGSGSQPLFLGVQSPPILNRTSPRTSDVRAIISFNSCPTAIGEDSRATMEGILEFHLWDRGVLRLYNIQGNYEQFSELKHQPSAKGASKLLIHCILLIPNF